MKLLPTKELGKYILSLDQVSLFSKVTGITESEIIRCNSTKSKKTINVIRGETNASVGFYTNGGKLRMHDYSDNRYRGDIFDIAGLIFNLNCNKGSDFILICKKLISLLDGEYLIKFDKLPQISGKPSTTDIEFISRGFDDNIDGKYWSKYGITSNQLANNKIYPVLSARLIKNTYIKEVYSFHTYDRCYAIVLYPSQYVKLYFVDRDGKNGLPRFMTNYPYPIERLDWLDSDATHLILAKSSKCRMVLDNVLLAFAHDSDFNITGKLITNSISTETIYFHKHWREILDRYSTIIMVDNDDVGLINHDRLTLEGYNVVYPPKAKDLSDLYIVDQESLYTFIYKLLWDNDIIQ